MNAIEIKQGEIFIEERKSVSPMEIGYKILELVEKNPSIEITLPEINSDRKNLDFYYKHLKNVLRQSNKRNTQEREMILNEIYSSTSGSNVKTIYKNLESKRIHVCRATIHNTINLFCSIGIAERFYCESSRSTKVVII